MDWRVLVALVLFFVIVRVARVNEGTAISLTVFGEFSKIIFRWKDHWIDTGWNIWRRPVIKEKLEEGSEGKEENTAWSQKIFGGLIVYFWPFQRIHRYRHRWTDIRLKDSKMVIEYHEEENFNHVLLKPAVYAFNLTAVETKPPERIPVDVLVLVTLRIRNPYLFLFVAPPTPVEDILARISAETRALVTSCEIDDLLQLKGASLWDLLRGAKVIEDTLVKWGACLAEKGIELQAIGLPPEYQAAAAAKRKNQLLAEGRAEEIMGTVISAVARAEGRSEKDIQDEFRGDPGSFYQKHQSIINNIMTKLAMEVRGYLKIEVPGATGLGGDLLRLIAAWKGIPPDLLKDPLAKETDKKEEKKQEEKPVNESLSFLSEKRPMAKIHQARSKQQK
jgi:hypothetical protein